MFCEYWTQHCKRKENSNNSVTTTIRNFTKILSENNWLTRQLINKKSRTLLTSEHLEIAKGTLKHKFTIGKVDNMHGSFERFKIYFN